MSSTQNTKDPEYSSVESSGRQHNGSTDVDPSMGNDDLRQYYPQPITPRPYTSLATEQAVEKSRIQSSRPLISFTLTQRRFEFARTVSLTDRHMPDKIAEYRRQQIPEYNLEKKQVDGSFQAAAPTTTSSAQTAFKLRLNKATQYHPMQADPAECAREMERFASSGGLARAAEAIEEAMLDMDTVDVHALALAHVASNAADIGHQVEALLRPVQTLHFTAPGASAAAPVRSVAWHPTHPGVVAFAAAHAPVVDAGLSQSLVIVWDLVDLLRPRAVLQAPDTVTALCWAPGMDQVLVAGLAGGQLCAFEVRGDAVCTLATLLGLGDGEIAVPRDLVFEDEQVDAEAGSLTGPDGGSGSPVASSVRDEASAAELGLAYPPLAPRALCPALPHPHAVTTDSEAAARGHDTSIASTGSSTAPASGTVAAETVSDLVPLLPVCVSAPEHAHAHAVTALHPLPPQIELNRRGELVRDWDSAGVHPASALMLSVGGDGQLLYWDLAALAPDAHVAEQAAATMREALMQQRIEAVGAGEDPSEADSATPAAKDSDANGDSGRARWRTQLRRAEPPSTAPEPDTALAAPAAPLSPLLYADTTAQALHVLARTAAPWTPFYRAALSMPGGAALRAVSVAVSSDAGVCMGGQGGEAAVGALVKPNGFRLGGAVAPRGPWEVACGAVGDGRHAPKGSDEHSVLMEVNGGIDSDSDAEEDLAVSGEEDSALASASAEDPSSPSFSEDPSTTAPTLSLVVPLLPSDATVRASPFYSDLLLVCGKWSFALWQRDCAFPLFTSPPAATALAAAEWSPSRPSVILVAAADGAVQLWDLLDSAAAPRTTHVSSTPLLSLATWSARAPAHSARAEPDCTATSAAVTLRACTAPTVQLLAVGDAAGRLHILEVSPVARAGSRADVVLFRRALRRELRRVRTQVARGVRVGQLGPRDLGRVLVQLEAGGKPVAGAGLIEEPVVGDQKQEEEAAEAAYQATLRAWRAKLAAMEAEED